MSRPRERLPLRKVVRVEADGRNVALTLECGHIRKHSGSVPLPVHSYCGECVPE